MHHDDHHDDHNRPRHHEDRDRHEPPRHDDHYSEPPRQHDAPIFHHEHEHVEFLVYRDRVEISGHQRETIHLHDIRAVETHGLFGRKLHIHLRNGHEREFHLGSGADQAAHTIRSLLEHH